MFIYSNIHKPVLPELFEKFANRKLSTAGQKYARIQIIPHHQ